MIEKQRGTALIIVTLMVFIVGALAAALGMRQQMTILKTSRFTHALQAKQYMLGAELYARQLLHQDGLQSTDDHKQEEWYLSHSAFDIPEGTVGLLIDDVQRKWNLYNSELSQIEFEEALLTLGLDKNSVAALSRWFAQERKDMAFANSAPEESGLASAISFVPMAELAAELDLSTQALQKLQACCIAVPQASIKLNVNTASSSVLNAYIRSPETRLILDSALSARGWVTSEELEGILAQKKNSSLSTRSNYFRVRTVVDIDGVVSRMTSIINRTPQQHTLNVIARSYGGTFTLEREP